MIVSPRILIAAGVAAACFFGGWQVQGWRKDAQIHDIEIGLAIAREEAREERLAKEAAWDEKALMALTLEQERERELEIVEREVEREVIRYVQSDAATECNLDSEWVRIHDRAASGRVSVAADSSSAPDGGASRADALTVVTVNYRIYHDLRNKYMTLQDFVRGLYE